MTIADAASLLAPISIDDFVERFLEREVLHLERNDPLVVDGIFDLESMGRCLRYGRPHLTDSVRVVAPDGGGEVTPAAERFRLCCAAGAPAGARDHSSSAGMSLPRRCGEQ